MIVIAGGIKGGAEKQLLPQILQLFAQVKVVTCF